MNPVSQIINQIISLFGCTPFCGSPSTSREWKLMVLKRTHAVKSSSPMPSTPISLCSSARATGTRWWFHGQTRPSELVPRTWEYAPLPHSSLCSVKALTWNCIPKHNGLCFSSMCVSQALPWSHTPISLFMLTVSPPGKWKLHERRGVSLVLHTLY